MTLILPVWEVTCCSQANRRSAAPTARSDSVVRALRLARHAALLPVQPRRNRNRASGPLKKSPPCMRSSCAHSARRGADQQAVSRQGRRDVGAYVPPERGGAAAPRHRAAREDSSASAHRRSYRDAVSVALQGSQVHRPLASPLALYVDSARLRLPLHPHADCQLEVALSVQPIGHLPIPT